MYCWGKKTRRLRSLYNGLLLAPLLFFVDNYDQPNTLPNKFCYVDDIVLATEDASQSDIEVTNS